jgi:S1-C subfamily serine protease
MNKNIILFLISITVAFGVTVMAQSVTTNISNSDYGIGYAKDIVQQRYHHIVNAQQTAFQNLPIKNVALPVQSSPHSSSLTDIFKQVQNSVVQITSKGNGIQIIINGNPPADQQSRLGSGFVYDQQGHIISNSHVVNGAKTVDVTFVDGNTYTANVIGNDPSSDVAVLQITDNNYSSAEKSGVPLVLANSSKLQVGEQIIAIGNPFGLSDTMTTGIVSQIGRLLPNQDTGFSIPNGIQTDAAINPGNSGGPLLNMQGQVVGMNTAILSGTGGFSGLGFAIPSNIIIRIVPTLIQK